MTDTLHEELTWDGKTPISENGVYRDIPLDAYHNNLDLLDAPAVSKSALKWLDPIQKNSSPKAFWGQWKYNPDHVKPKPSEALDFGKATHCLLLGDEDFDAAFVVRPEKYPDYKKADAREWRDAQIEAGKTIVTPDQYERIQRMRDDANEYPFVQQGLMTGRVERSMFWKDPDSGYWPGKLPFSAGERFIKMKPWSRQLLDQFIAYQHQIAGLGGVDT